MGQIKNLKASGQDESKHYPPITVTDIKKMYSTQVVSANSPEHLQNQVFFEAVLHFGRRGVEGLRKLQKDHIVFLHSEDGTEYATLNHNAFEKNHQGVGSNEEEHVQLMFATGGEHCPVKQLKLYISKLNPKCSALFQRPKVKNWRLSSSWYMNIPVSEGTIGGFMPRISEEAELSIRYTNHSIRATTVSSLREAGIHPNDIRAITGHRSVASIESYSRGPSMGKRADYSNLLSSLREDSSSPAVSTTPAVCASVSGQTGESITPAVCDSVEHGLVSSELAVAEPVVTATVQSSVSVTSQQLRSLFQNVVFNNSTIHISVGRNDSPE